VNDSAPTSSLSLSISAVERDTGLSKDTLRVWERRYGFPSPGRDDIGERAYSLAQVEKLRVVKRLLDAGHRPGRIVPMDLSALQVLSEQTVDHPARSLPAAMDPADLRAHMALIRRHDPAALRSTLNLMLARVGVLRFVHEVVVPLNAAVGDAWLRGQLEIFEEHQFTETMQTVLRRAIGAIPPPADADIQTIRPRVLLTTVPGEPHGMGLLLVEAVLALEGCCCISLGVQTPLWDIALAANAYQASIVGLSFTGCMSPNQIADGLTELRAKLPPQVHLWAGGSAPVLHRRPIPGVTPFASLEPMLGALQRWRETQMTTP
jgi:methanogenic corrinoid protein MtbC1